MRHLSYTPLVYLAVPCLAFAGPAHAQDAQALSPASMSIERDADAAGDAGLGPATAASADEAGPQPGPLAPDPAPLFAAVSEIVVTSSYVWRGFAPAGFSVQPALSIAAGPVTVSSWMNLAGAGTTSPMTEHDLTVDYRRRAPGGQIAFGYVNYIFPGSEPAHSQEIYAGYTHGSRFSPALHVYYDFDAGTGTYVQARLSHARALAGSGLELSTTLGVGYNHRQWIDDSTWSDMHLGISLALPAIAGRLALSPFVARSQSLNDAEFPSRWYGGMGVSIK